MSDHICAADGHGPEWAAAVADLADRAGSAFSRSGVQRCLSVVDLEPWRLLDAWWLRRCLEPLARLSGRPVRYVPCVGSGSLPRGPIAAFAPAWSVGTAPVELCWPTRRGWPHSKATGQAWAPDGAVLVLAGNLPQRLSQDLLLAHHGQVHEWRGDPSAWHPLEAARHADWIAESLNAYANGLPSSMLSLPIGYWRFLEQAIAWASHGCLILARAEGWSSLAEIREDAAQRTNVSAASPPVNFHWLAQHLPRIRASAHTVRASRKDAVQLIASGLPEGDGVLPSLCAPLTAVTRSARADRARAVRVLAAGGDLDAALSLLQLSEHDPALLRAAWDALAPVAATASALLSAKLGTWLERLMADNPWICDDSALLRGAGHVALACARVDLAQTALRALDELGRASAADLVALGRCLEQLGQFPAALTACDRALSRHPGQQDALTTRERIAARMAKMAGPWQVQHETAGYPLLLDPLHVDHAPMLVRQIRDPSIPTMTALPMLAEGDDGQAWIRARLEEGPAAYAIIHRQLGFVGFIQLRLWESTAFVCYWIGIDFQGMGFCTPALALATELATRNGVDLLLSSAYNDNVRSTRVLRKGGFTPMNVRATPPDSDRTFVMLSAAPMEDGEARQRLIDFCDNTTSGLHFEPLLDATPRETSSTSTGSAGAI